MKRTFGKFVVPLLAAVIALGADGAVFGTWFLASHEAEAHPIF